MLLRPSREHEVLLRDRLRCDAAALPRGEVAFAAYTETRWERRRPRPVRGRVVTDLRTVGGNRDAPTRTSRRAQCSMSAAAGPGILGIFNLHGAELELARGRHILLARLYDHVA